MIVFFYYLQFKQYQWSKNSFCTGFQVQLFLKDPMCSISKGFIKKKKNVLNCCVLHEERYKMWSSQKTINIISVCNMLS